MDARQDRLANPLGMDEDCAACPDLCETRSRVVHGYGPVDADVVVVGEMPSSEADDSGGPFEGTQVPGMLAELGLWDEASDEPHDAYLTHLTRCRHPDRGPTDSEERNCDAFLSADVRMVSPELLVPVGGRALRALAADHTTRDPTTLDVEACHATTVRGRGFDLLPTVADPDEAERAAFVAHVRGELGRDYRQTKGRRGSESRAREE
ncbi:uracil-DNA glycosylase [Halomarina litorea]|uniref:uracil-DNA glycosylase n=1 Tax=Halomarina litorea TaxID=2961595 RepID=UPI0020C35A55|nr:uracil-DNA glycosylase family protein [Halomarina sp. BCD28]